MFKDAGILFRIADLFPGRLKNSLSNFCLAVRKLPTFSSSTTQATTPGTSSPARNQELPMTLCLSLFFYALSHTILSLLVTRCPSIDIMDPSVVDNLNHLTEILCDDRSAVRHNNPCSLDHDEETTV